MAGVLLDDESQGILAHLGDCHSCRSQAALMAAVRTALPQAPAGPQCLSDEEFSLLRDDLLPDERRESALAHLAGCNSCMGALVSLDRALEQAESSPVSPPAHLVKKAIAVGMPEEKKASWLARLLDLSPAFRFSLAAAAAAGVFFLTILLTSPGPKSTESPASGPQLAVETEPPTAPPAPALAEKPDEKSVEKDQALVPARETAPAESGRNDTKLAIAEGHGPKAWLGGLSDKDRLTLLDRMKPNAKLPGPASGRALTARTTRSPVADAYLVGRAAGALDDFSGHLDNPPETRRHLAGSTRSMATLLNQVPDQQKIKKLAGFSIVLAKKLASPDTPADTVRRRVEVFTEALDQSVSVQAELELGYRLGRLTWAFEVYATALDLGRQPPRQAWPSRKSIVRVRQLLKKTSGLPEQQKAEVLRGLESLEKTAPLPPGRDKATRILDELREMDRQIRSSR